MGTATSTTQTDARRIHGDAGPCSLREFPAGCDELGTISSVVVGDGQAGQRDRLLDVSI